MKKTLAFSVLLFISFLSQITQAQKIGIVSGVIIDQSTKANLPNVGVALFKAKDSTQVKGEITNMEGKFTLNKLPAGKYYVMAGAMGYDNYSSEVFDITTEKPDINLGTIELSPRAIEMKELEIVAKRPFIEQEAGKIIVNPDSDPAGTGDNVLELLKKVPGVTVDNDETIKLNGKSGVLILVDNKQTYLSGDALIMLLKNMPTSGVDKVEAISNPSEKYDAEGVSGILNIKTKRNRNIGVNGSVYVNGGYSNIFKHSEGLDLSMRLQKWTVYGNIGNNHYPSKSDSKSSLIYPDGTSFETNMQDNERWLYNNKYNGQNYKLGADYYLNDRNIFGFVWRMSNSNYSSDVQSYTRIKRNEMVDSSYSSIGDGNSNYNYNVFNLNYKHIFDSLGTELNIDLDYSLNENPSESDNNTSYYENDFSALKRSELIENNYQYKTSVYSAKADFEHPFSQKLRFSAGAKTSFVTNDNDRESFNSGNMDIDRTNHFIYNENISALYAGLSIMFNQQTSMRLGLRGEYTHTKGYLENIDSTNIQNYFDLFPNLSFRQQLGKKNSFDFVYRYRIQRPGYSSLNPFLYKNNQYSYSSGNPDLQPQYSHSLVLTHSFMNMFFTSVDYAYSTDQSIHTSYFNPETFVSVSRPQNIGINNSLWISLSGSIPITKWWYCSLYGGFGWSVSRLDYVDSLVHNNTFNSYAWLGNYFTITKNLTAEISGWGRPKSEDNNFSTNQAMFSINAGLRQTFLNRKLSVKLSVNDIFNTSSWKAEYDYPSGVKSKQEYYWGGRSLWLMVSYQFGKQDIKIRQRKTASEEEQSRIGGSGGSSGENNSGGGK